ncbi:hypothetical protein BN1232_05361 [Mycobacterium lentiflavum]|uniref:Uncharacterized protein n=1 Tax=Mycobacterium lentiflavum TaxID=141349 RepID=A0A0E4CQK2_MYCLN|nr:hypothetical protein [Mycobacterium lentiflavum]CQD21728.1 hypothetical protein BN1232_05361 [Mycobacterium lentiflavum]
MRIRESLLDTFPGRLFIRDMWLSGGFDTPEHLIRAAASAVGRYLYSGGCLDVADFDVNDSELRQLDAVSLAALTALPPFDSPQIHQGTLGTLRAPNVRNRNPLSALPDGAFWTSTPVTADEDSWTLCGENLRREMPRWEIYFDIARVRVARIESARDWADLIDSNTVAANGCKYPDWPAIAQSWDAVHLSPTGLLLAHPQISTTPFSSADGSGHVHSQTGPYASVGDWSSVSTAWLHEPPKSEFTRAPAPIDPG